VAAPTILIRNLVQFFSARHDMRRWILLSLLVALAVPLQAQRNQPPVGTGTTHDFGKVRQGAVVAHEFRILNPSEAGPAHVARVDLDGPGMTARFRADVAPGEFVTIKVTWNTSKVDGTVQAEGMVRWADPRRAPATFTLTGQVVPSIELKPLGAVFFSAFTNERPVQVVQILNHDDRPLHVQRTEVNGTHFEARLEEVQTGRRHDLHITVTPGPAPGRFQERLIVYTDSPARPVINVPVNIFVKADVYANPEVVDFGNVDLAAVRRNPALLPLLSQKFLVKRRQGPFEIRAASIDVPGLVVNASTGKEDTHEVNVSLTPDKLVAGPMIGRVRLVTTDARFPEILVPVRGRIQ